MVVLDGQLVYSQLKDPTGVAAMDFVLHVDGQIQTLRTSVLSLLPGGLLDAFQEQQIRDLVSYVTQKQ